MWTRQRRRRSFGWLVVPTLMTVVAAYFFHHSSVGRYGSMAQAQVRIDLDRANNQLSELTAKRERLEHEVALMRDGTIERDTLDEQARLSLGHIGSNDVILRASAVQ